MRMLYEIIDKLEAHPFTLISLSDREKFHTGMLAYTLRRLFDDNRDHALKLVRSLWGEGTNLRPLEEAQKIEVFVEKKSIDLGLAADDCVVLFAEMKLKTGLADHQLKAYQDKHQAASGVVLGLFCEETGIPAIPSRKFPLVLSDTLGSDPLSRSLTAANDDGAVLIRMWRQYLTLLSRLAEHFEKLELQQIEEPLKFENALNRLRLKGIFEAYRYRRITATLRNMNCPVTPEAFNSHGNAGLDFKIASDLPFGLQWQAKALKIFVVDPEYQQVQKSTRRDDRLMQLANDYINKFKLNGPIKLGPNGRFRSVVVSRWNVFDDCRGCAEHLVEGLKYLSEQRIGG